ncbi:MAG: penicillin-binding protein activator [Nitrosomonadales bacterium]|nr:penicillin-binding protein activator [Nitrosomonadales bacterium]
MQRVLLLFLALFALYAGAAPLTPGDKNPLAVSGSSGVPALPAPASAIPAAEIKHMPATAPLEKSFPHIALLLPLQSATFGSAAEAVRQGFFAAVNYKRQKLPVRVYSNFDENSSVVPVYRQAIANGAVAVVGPLTRNGVSALAAEKDIPVPTLALNIIEGQFAPQLYFFGMAVEAEARQVAQLAKQQNLHQAIIITTRSQLSQRLQTAFEEEWTGPEQGATSARGILREIEFNDDPTAFADIADITDTLVFLAADADRARLIRPYLPNKLPIYATSQIFVGNENTLANYDLNGIRFVDMPWLLQPDHPAVMIYSRSNPTLSADRERLYALGIDSFRLTQLILSNQLQTALPLDGVSGQIQLSGHHFQHMAVPAVLFQGRAQPPDAPTSAPAHVFPDTAVDAQ